MSTRLTGQQTWAAFLPLECMLEQQGPTAPEHRGASEFLPEPLAAIAPHHPCPRTSPSHRAPPGRGCGGCELA